MLHQLAPFRAHHLHQTGSAMPADVVELDSADACALHRLQVGGDALAGHVAVDPIPVGMGTRRNWRIEESKRQSGGFRSNLHVWLCKQQRCNQGDWPDSRFADHGRIMIQMR